MTPTPTHRASADRRAASTGGSLLAAAAALVGIAIILDGPIARAVNGVGALAWVAAAVLLARSLRGSPRIVAGSLAAAAIIAVLILVVRPGDLLAAALGFAVGGALVAAVAPTRALTWALLLAAAWLPGHILLRVALSALAGQTRVRVEPPPTAALVPLAIVLAAAAGGLAVAALHRRRRRPVPLRSGTAHPA